MIGKDLGTKHFGLTAVTCQFRTQDLTLEGTVPTSGWFTSFSPTESGPMQLCNLNYIKLVPAQMDFSATYQNTSVECIFKFKGEGKGRRRMWWARSIEMLWSLMEKPYRLSQKIKANKQNSSTIPQSLRKPYSCPLESNWTGQRGEKSH